MAIITPAVRDILIEHIDGAIPYVRRIDGGRRRAWEAAVANGLVVFGPPNAKPPKYTRMTERGREELAKALGDWADALVRAQHTAVDFLAAFQNKAGKVAESKHLDEPRQLVLAEGALHSGER